ncbi:uncharacterized protein LOC111641992 [Centruroides sculpturatus]|uniref:uncharacterized protein LOC111641992 n=1 Tax=Centruroides sculpturatus TaxID=218467 RepID=UPI000C6D57EB|nr:uncharacterized protein LOC111641992 [Centruroides sculpturatus]
MKNNIENDYKRILYFLILLLFLLVLLLSFLFICLLQYSNMRITSLEIQENNKKSRKTNDEDAIINENTIGHQAKKREISSQTDKGCQKDCSPTPNPPEKNCDTLKINENWSVKKTDYLGFCFAADQFCGRNRENSKDEQEDNLGGENKQENKNCILQNITEDETFQYQNFSFHFTGKYRSIFRNIEEGPKDNYKIISQELGDGLMKEFRLNEKREVKILKQFKLPEQMFVWGIIGYNGNIYGRHKNFSEGRIIKYNIETEKLTFGDKFDFNENKHFVYLFHGDNFFWAFEVISQTLHYLDTVLVGYKMDFDNLKVLSKLNFTSNNFNYRFTFVAYDKLYRVYYRSGKIYISSALNDEEFLYIDVQEDVYRFERVMYNAKEQNLYLQSTDYKHNYQIIVKKLHFNCSNED